MKAIFNSLGSNYDFRFAMSALFSVGTNGEKELNDILTKKYGSKPTLTYKGRHALELVLQSLNLPKYSRVAINGFTCFSVYKSIVNCDLKPIYLDIEENGLNFTAEMLEKRLQTENNIKVVIIQNTLGYPCDIKAIQAVCRENKLILIEDLAHSIGTVYSNGEEVGTIGDFVTLSFSQDKVVDAVSGGAAVSRSFKITADNLQTISLCHRLKDRFYPLLTWKIRRSYPFGIGKILHHLLKSLNLLPKPVVDDRDKAVYHLPQWQANLAAIGFANLDIQLAHRQKIANFYAQNMSFSLLLSKITPLIKNSVNLRFPIIVKNRDKLIAKLKEEKIFLADIWYDAPIAPKKYLDKTDYQIGRCPNAEALSEVILNLPTHQNVDLNDAKKIVEIVNCFQKENDDL